MISLLLLFTTQIFASTSATYNADYELRISNLETEIRNFTSGRSTITANHVYIGTPTYNAIRFNDGTIQVTSGTSSSSSVSSSTSIPVSSFTYVPETSITATTFGTAVTTVIMTTDGAPVDLFIVGSQINTGVNDDCWAVLIDGDFPTVNGIKLTSSQAIQCHAAAANTCHPVAGMVRIDAPIAGSHSFALTAGSSGGSTKFLGGTTSCNNSSKVKTIFGAQEIINSSMTGAHLYSSNTWTAQNVFTSTITILGKDSNGYSLFLTSGISMSGGSIAAGQISGVGSDLTALNASNLSAGIVASGRISGSYTGITSIGTLGSLTVSGNSSLATMNASGSAGFAGITATSGTFTQTGTSNYSLQTSSGLNMQAGKLTIGSGGGVYWADGTVSTSAFSTPGGSSADVSSFTFVRGETGTSQTSAIIAVATITKTVAAVPLEIDLLGTLVNTATADNCWTILVDGDFPIITGVKLTASDGLQCGSSICQPASGPVMIDALTAASHTFALVPFTSGGTIKFLDGTTSCNNSKKGRTIFGVRERH